MVRVSGRGRGHSRAIGKPEVDSVLPADPAAPSCARAILLDDLLTGADPGEQVYEVVGGEFPAERPCGLVVPGDEGQQGALEFRQADEVIGRDDLLLDVEKKIWFSQETCTGAWIMIAFGWALRSGSIAAWPRWSEPLSTMTNTRSASL